MNNQVVWSIKCQKNGENVKAQENVLKSLILSTTQR